MATAPSIPTNMQVQQGNGQVLITCNQIVGATGYPIQRSTDNVNFTVIATPAVPSYVDTTVTVGTQYYYQMAATNGSATSSYCTSQAVVPTLPGQMTLGQIRLLAKQKADRVNSQFITDPEWNTYINQSYFELYDILVQKYGNEYFVAPPAQFLTYGSSPASGSQFYALPDGITPFLAADGSTFVPKAMYKLLGVDLGIGTNNNAWITLKKFMFISRNRYVYPQLTTNLLGVAGLRYRIVGNQIEFIPQPANGQYIQLWYIPRMTTLLQDSDIADGVSGWTEYIAIDAAIKALQKEESDVTVLALQKQAMLDRIEAAAENRDAGEPETISDTRRYTDLYGFGSPQGDGPFGGF